MKLATTTNRIKIENIEKCEKKIDNFLNGENDSENVQFFLLLIFLKTSEREKAKEFSIKDFPHPLYNTFHNSCRANN